jgi:hypothetical protein
VQRGKSGEQESRRAKSQQPRLAAKGVKVDRMEQVDAGGDSDSALELDLAINPTEN